MELGQQDPGVEVHPLGAQASDPLGHQIVDIRTKSVRTRSMLPSVSYGKPVPSHELPYMAGINLPQQQQPPLAGGGHVRLGPGLYLPCPR